MNITSEFLWFLCEFRRDALQENSPFVEHEVGANQDSNSFPQGLFVKTK